MRPSKSRSRGKSNRNRNNNNNSNNVNRVFDSSGPEGRVRGTPQQVFEKYTQLARDAELGNDRVAQENFQQHAEHYLRMVTAAQKEADARRDQHDRENRERQAERDRERQERQEREAANRKAADARREENQQRYDAGQQKNSEDQPQSPPPQASSLMGGDMVSQMQGDDPAEAPQPDVIDMSGSGGNGLVDTPENPPSAAKPKPKPKRAPRKPRTKKPAKPAPNAELHVAEENPQADTAD